MSLDLPPRTLVECEIVIKRGLSTFVEVGTALLEIRDARLYLETHGSFEDYCRERWDLSKPYASHLIVASETVAIATIADLPAPRTESVARELAPLREEPTQLREAWSEAVERNGGQPTAAQVREVVDGKRAGAHAKTTICLRCKSRVRLDRPHRCPEAHRQLEAAHEALTLAYMDLCNYPGAGADLPGCLDLAEKCERLAGRVRVRLQDDAKPVQDAIEGVGLSVCGECGSRLGDFKGRPSFCFGCATYRGGRSV